MNEMRRVISTGKIVTKTIITLAGFYVIVSTGPDVLFNDPLYTMVVLVFLFVLMSDDDGTVKGGK